MFKQILVAICYHYQLCEALVEQIRQKAVKKTTGGKFSRGEGEVLLALRSADVRKKGIATTMQHLFVCCIIFTCTYTFWRTCHFFFEMLGLMLGFVTALLSFCFAA